MGNASIHPASPEISRFSIPVVTSSHHFNHNIYLNFTSSDNSFPSEYKNSAYNCKQQHLRSKRVIAYRINKQNLQKALRIHILNRGICIPNHSYEDCDVLSSSKDSHAKANSVRDLVNKLGLQKVDDMTIQSSVYLHSIESSDAKASPRQTFCQRRSNDYFNQNVLTAEETDLRDIGIPQPNFSDYIDINSGREEVQKGSEYLANQDAYKSSRIARKNGFNKCNVPCQITSYTAASERNNIETTFKHTGEEYTEEDHSTRKLCLKSKNVNRLTQPEFFYLTDQGSFGGEKNWIGHAVNVEQTKETEERFQCHNDAYRVSHTGHMTHETEFENVQNNIDSGRNTKDTVETEATQNRSSKPLPKHRLLLQANKLKRERSVDNLSSRRSSSVGVKEEGYFEPVSPKQAIARPGLPLPATSYQTQVQSSLQQQQEDPKPNTYYSLNSNTSYMPASNQVNTEMNNRNAGSFGKKIKQNVSSQEASPINGRDPQQTNFSHVTLTLSHSMNRINTDNNGRSIQDEFQNLQRECSQQQQQQQQQQPKQELSHRFSIKKVETEIRPEESRVARGNGGYSNIHESFNTQNFGNETGDVQALNLKNSLESFDPPSSYYESNLTARLDKEKDIFLVDLLVKDNNSEYNRENYQSMLSDINQKVDGILEKCQQITDFHNKSLVTYQVNTTVSGVKDDLKVDKKEMKQEVFKKNSNTKVEDKKIENLDLVAILNQHHLSKPKDLGQSEQKQAVNKAMESEIQFTLLERSLMEKEEDNRDMNHVQEPSNVAYDMGESVDRMKFGQEREETREIGKERPFSKIRDTEASEEMKYSLDYFEKAKEENTEKKFESMGYSISTRKSLVQDAFQQNRDPSMKFDSAFNSCSGHNENGSRQGRVLCTEKDEYSRQDYRSETKKTEGNLDMPLLVRSKTDLDNRKEDREGQIISDGGWKKDQYPTVEIQNATRELEMLSKTLSDISKRPEMLISPERLEFAQKIIMEKIEGIHLDILHRIDQLNKKIEAKSIASQRRASIFSQDQTQDTGKVESVSEIDSRRGISSKEASQKSIIAPNCYYSQARPDSQAHNQSVLQNQVNYFSQNIESGPTFGQLESETSNRRHIEQQLKGQKTKQSHFEPKKVNLSIQKLLESSMDMSSSAVNKSVVCAQNDKIKKHYESIRQAATAGCETVSKLASPISSKSSMMKASIHEKSMERDIELEMALSNPTEAEPHGVLSSNSTNKDIKQVGTKGQRSSSGESAGNSVLKKKLFEKKIKEVSNCKQQAASVSVTELWDLNPKPQKYRQSIGDSSERRYIPNPLSSRIDTQNSGKYYGGNSSRRERELQSNRSETNLMKSLVEYERRDQHTSSSVLSTSQEWRSREDIVKRNRLAVELQNISSLKRSRDLETPEEPERNTEEWRHIDEKINRHGVLRLQDYFASQPRERTKELNEYPINSLLAKENQGIATTFRLEMSSKRELRDQGVQTTEGVTDRSEPKRWKKSKENGAGNSMLHLSDMENSRSTTSLGKTPERKKALKSVYIESLELLSTRKMTGAEPRSASRMKKSDVTKTLEKQYLNNKLNRSGDKGRYLGVGQERTVRGFPVASKSMREHAVVTSELMQAYILGQKRYTDL